MSMDDVKHAEDELFDSTAEEETDTEGDDGSTNSASTTSQEDEESDLVLEDPKEQAAQQFAEAWAKKVQSGDATLEELKEKQPWLVPKVNALLNSKKEPSIDNEALKKLLKEEAEKLRREMREEAQFDSIRRSVNNLGLPKSKRDAVSKKYTQLREKGLSKVDAIELTIETLNIDLEDSSRSKFPSVKTGSSSRNSDDNDFDPNALDEEKRLALIKKKRGY